MNRAYLILQNGQVFEGRRFGAPGQVKAELVFNTGVVGYLETITDPACMGQIVVQTFPLIGNYGVIPQDLQSRKPLLSAYVIRQLCDTPSNFRCEGDLNSYLTQNGVVGLMGVDTRQLTRILREAGLMNAAIVDELPQDMEEFLIDLAGVKTQADPLKAGVQQVCTMGEGRFHVALWDMGATHHLAQAMLERGCKVSLVPPGASAAQIAQLDPQGILISGGPGDPAACPRIVDQVREAARKGLPVMGVGLGHQLLALSQGARSFKMKFGHHGGNQAVRRISDGRLFTTSQNHGYSVVNEGLPMNLQASYVNLHDGTNEGLTYGSRPMFSVQFEPSAQAGAQGTSFLFDQFIKLMEG